jgi:hypothetical protein
VIELEWNEAKRAANLAKHGLDFPIAEAAFDGRPVCTVEVLNAGEVRRKTLFGLDGRFLVLIWTERERRVRIISLRSANHAEIRRLGAGDP